MNATLIAKPALNINLLNANMAALGQVFLVWLFVWCVPLPPRPYSYYCYFCPQLAPRDEMKREEYAHCNESKHQRCEESPNWNTCPHKQKWSNNATCCHNGNHSWTVHSPKLYRRGWYFERWRLWKFARKIDCQIKCQDDIYGEERHGGVEDGPNDTVVCK